MAGYAHLVCESARDDVAETVSMITGRYFFFDTMDVALTVEGFPWNYPKAHVQIERVPHRQEYYDNPPLVAGLPGGRSWYRPRISFP